jgi:hypothetical protein
MSTIKVDTIKDTNNVEVYTAKAWVNFNSQGTLTVREDGNVSSVVDNGTGNYTIQFSNSLSDNNYSFVGSVSSPAGLFSAVGTVEMPDNVAYSTSKTTSSLTIETTYVNASANRTNADFDEVNVVVFR